MIPPHCWFPSQGVHGELQGSFLLQHVYQPKVPTQILVTLIRKMHKSPIFVAWKNMCLLYVLDSTPSGFFKTFKLATWETLDIFIMPHWHGVGTMTATLTDADTRDLMPPNPLTDGILHGRCVLIL